MTKSSLYATVILLLAAAPCITAQGSDEFKPAGKIFGLLFTNYHTTFSGGVNTSAFEVTRSYLGFDYAFSKTFSSRIMYDGMTETINQKTVYTGYLRNAYLQYDNGTITLRGGLIGIEQISVMDRLWNYRFITKPPIDYSGMIFPADIGIMGKVKAGDKAALDMAVINGRGFKDLAANGTYKLALGACLYPAKDFTVRGYYDIMGPSGSRQWTAALTGAYTGGAFTAGAEYLIQNNHGMTAGNNYSAYSIFTTIHLTDRINLFARYDQIRSVVPESGDEPWNLEKDGSSVFIGIDLSPARNVRISPNFAGFIPADEGSDFRGTLGLNVEARF